MNNNKRSSCGSSDEPWGYFTDDYLNTSSLDNSPNERNNILLSSSPNSFNAEFQGGRIYNSINCRNKLRKTDSNLNIYHDSSDNISGSSDDGNNTYFSQSSSSSKLTSSSSSSSSSRSNKSSLSSIPSSSSFVQKDDKDKIILCRMDNILSSTSCRSFSDLSTTGYGHWEDVTIALKGFRIVQTSSRGEEAEFCVILTTNDNEYCCWKPYNCFVEIAEACKAVNLNMKEKILYEQEIGHKLTDLEWHTMTKDQNIFYKHRELDILLSYIYDSFSLGNNNNKKKKNDIIFSGTLKNTLSAWQDVVKNRSIWYKKNLEINHLIKESNRLDNFLKQFLFDINSPNILIDFMKS